MSKSERLMIGIVGQSCAGKTTLLRHIREYFRTIGKKTAVVQFDDYDLYPSGSKAMEEEKINPKVTNWEKPTLFALKQYERDIRDLSAGKSVTIFNRARENLNSSEEKKEIEPDTITIVEGLFTLYPDGIEDFFDLTFFIDVPPDEMVKRRLARTPEGSDDPWDQPEYIRGPMVEGTELYVNPQKAKVKEENILDGTQPIETIAQTIIKRIVELLG